MKRSAGIGALVVLIGATQLVTGVAEATPVSCRISKAEFAQIANGMGRVQVNTIVGCKGKSIKTVGNRVTIQWKGSPRNSYANIVFQSAKVVAKTYKEPPPGPCDPNYTGCVPIASDVDCLGGSGDGPAYTGPVRVIGTDIYRLDTDHDGFACENS